MKWQLCFLSLFLAAAPPGIARQAPAPAAQGDTLWQEISNPGVARASAAVDTVFLDRLAPRTIIGGGDFASYLIARLGIRPIPSNLKLRVAVDSQRLAVSGRIGDLPLEAQAALGPVFGLMGPDTRFLGEIGLGRAGPTAVRFRLLAVSVNDVPLPEFLLQTVMTDVGRRYPALTATGRDLLVELPATAQIVLVPGGIALLGPTDSSAPPPGAPPQPRPVGAGPKRS